MRKAFSDLDQKVSFCCSDLLRRVTNTSSEDYFFLPPLSFIYFLYKSSSTNSTKAKGKTEKPLCNPSPTTCLGFAIDFCRAKMLYLESQKCPKAQSHSDVSQTRFMVKALYFNCFVTKYISRIVLIKGH